MIAATDRQLRRALLRCRRFAEGTSGIMAIAILFSCLLANSAWGQSTGALRGTVEDATGEYVLGADVRLRNQTTGQELSTSSDEDGQFRFDHVTFGDYLLIVYAQGFKSAEIQVKVGERAESPIRVPLQIAASVESVTVSANSPSMPTAGQNIDFVDLDPHWLATLPAKEGDPLAVPSIFLDPST